MFFDFDLLHLSKSFCKYTKQFFELPLCQFESNIFNCLIDVITLTYYVNIVNFCQVDLTPICVVVEYDAIAIICDLRFIANLSFAHAKKSVELVLRQLGSSVSVDVMC